MSGKKDRQLLPLRGDFDCLFAPGISSARVLLVVANPVIDAVFVPPAEPTPCLLRVLGKRELDHQSAHIYFCSFQALRARV
jgi:hypothetical protein